MLGFELLASIVSLVVAVAICVLSRSVPQSLAPHFWAGAGAFPFILGAILALLSLVWVVDSARSRAAARREAVSEHPVSWFEEVIGPPSRQRRLIIIAASTLVFGFLLIPLFGMISSEYGFMGATFLFMLFNLKIFSHLAVKHVVAIALLTAVSVYVIFTYLLLLPMPR